MFWQKKKKEKENKLWKLTIGSRLSRYISQKMRKTCKLLLLGIIDHEPHCEAFAYRNDGNWYWSLDDAPVKVEITAWKYSCEPYKEN